MRRMRPPTTQAANADATAVAVGRIGYNLIRIIIRWHCRFMHSAKVRGRSLVYFRCAR